MRSRWGARNPRPAERRGRRGAGGPPGGGGGATGAAVLPGGEVATIARARALAAEIGYPLLIKPSAGEGGRGIRRVDAAAELTPQLRAARRDAAAAFGDDRVYLERLIVRARHVEVQVAADDHGRTVGLGERDCSVQRRFEKVVEEAPALPDGARG